MASVLPGILVVGSANIDYIITTERLPAMGETVSGDDLTIRFGGKGANQAVAAARLGGNVAMLAAVGDDGMGRSYLEHLANEGIDIGGCFPVAGHSTGAALITVDAKGNNTIVVGPGANASLTSDQWEAHSARLKEAAIVVLQLEIPHETVAVVLREANRLRKRVIFNPSPLSRDFRWEPATIDTMIVNEGELRQLAPGHEHPDQAAEAIRQRGVTELIVTRGGDPTLVYSPQFTGTVPTVSAKAVDTVGAGDTFAGTFAWATSRGKDIREAVALANKAAALAIQAIGAQESMPRFVE